MSSFKSLEPHRKSYLKSSVSTSTLTSRTSLSRKEPSQRRASTVASIKSAPKERLSSGKWNPNNVFPNARSQTFLRDEPRVPDRKIPTSIINQPRRQQTFTQRAPQGIRPTVRSKMPLLPTSSKTKTDRSSLSSSIIRNEVLGTSLQNNMASVAPTSRTIFTSLPEHLYKGSRLPIPIIQLGRKLPAAPERARTNVVRTAWIRKAEKEKRPIAKSQSMAFTERYTGKSNIPHLHKDVPTKSVKENARINSASLRRLSTYHIPCDTSPVPLDIYIPLRELTLMNQKISQVSGVLVALQGTVNTVEESIKEAVCPRNEISEDLMLSRSDLKSNFESMRRVFKTVCDTMTQLKTLNMKALRLYTKEMLPPRERKPMLPPRENTFLVSEDSKKESARRLRASGTTIEDSQIVGKSIDVIRTALDVSLLKDEDITVEELRDQIVDAQIDLLDDAVMSPAMTITDQLLRSEELKIKTIQEAEEFVRSRQSFNPNETIVEAIEEIEEGNPLNIKAHELVMEVLAEALQDDPDLIISDISPRQMEETGSNRNSLTVPITEEILTKEGNISVFDLELSLQEATRILDAIDPFPSVTMASHLYDVLTSESLKTTIVNKSIGEYPDLTVRDIQENLQVVQGILHNAELHPESSKIGQLMKFENLSENPLVGKILRKETSSNPDRTISSLESKISDLADSLNENAAPQRELQMSTEGGESEEDASLKRIENVCESLRVSAEASENVADVVMEAIVETSLKENPAISLAETKENVVKAQMLLALSAPSLTTKIVDLYSPELLESSFIPRIINKAVSVRGNISVSELHQSFEEVKERLGKAAVAPHMIRLFLLLNEPNRLNLSPKCALLKDAILTSSVPLSLYWKSYYAAKLPQIEANYPSPDSVKLKVKIIKNAIESFQGKECNTGFLIKMLKKWKCVLKKVRPDHPAATIPACKWSSFCELSQSIIEEIACRHPLRMVSGLLADVTKLIDQLNSVSQIGNTVATFEPEAYENDAGGLAFEEIVAKIIDVARSVDGLMPVEELSKKIEILKGSLEEFVENSADATVIGIIEEGKLQAEVRKRVIDVATSIHPGMTALQMKRCLSEIQNDLENVAVVPDQIAISSLHVEDPVFSKEMILYTKNEIINEAVRQDPDMSLGDLKKAISTTHKCLLGSKPICYCPNEDLQTPINFVMKAIHNCPPSSDKSINRMDLLEMIGRNLLSSNSIDPNRTVQEEQNEQLKEEKETKEFNPFDIAYLANQYPPMRHAVVANILFKPLALHTLRPFIPDLLKSSSIEQLPNETPIDYNGREDTNFDFLRSVIQPYSYYKKIEYASRRRHEESTKVLFYEK